MPTDMFIVSSFMVLFGILVVILVLALSRVEGKYENCIRKEGICVYKPVINDLHETEYWITGCGSVFPYSVEPSALQSNYKYCPFCGAKIVIKTRRVFEEQKIY